MAGKYGARRSKLLKRDGNYCYWCAEAMDTGPSARRNPQSPWSCTIEHLRPKAHGGCNHLPNLVLAHQICNERRDQDWDGITHCDCETWLRGDTHRFGLDTRPTKGDRSSGGVNAYIAKPYGYLSWRGWTEHDFYGIVAYKNRRGLKTWYEENTNGSQNHERPCAPGTYRPSAARFSRPLSSSASAARERAHGMVRG